jgi:hypothetical protein
MLMLHHVLGEVLMNEPPECSPLVTVKHDKKMVSFGDEIM